MNVVESLQAHLLKMLPRIQSKQSNAKENWHTKEIYCDQSYSECYQSNFLNWDSIL